MRRTLPRTLTFSNFVSAFAHSIRRILRRMWDMAFRHGFGAVRVGDDAAEERVVPREEGADEIVDASTSDNDDGDLSLQGAIREAFSGALPSSPPTASTSNLWAAAAEHLHAPANSPRAPIDEVLGNPDYFAKSPSSDGCPSLIGDPEDDEEQACMTPPREVQQPDFGEPFLTLTPEENAAMAAMVAPANDKLVRLKTFTPDSMPAYHQDMQRAPYAQVLKKRLATIARSIQFGKHMSDEERLRTELKLCRHIATEYWPLPVTPTTHLDIHRIYRNALFRQTATEQLQQEHTMHRIWVDGVADTKRPSMSFGEAASRFTGAMQAQQEMVDAAEAEDIENRRKQEETDREAAEALDRELNKPHMGYDGPSYTSPYQRDEAAGVAAQALFKWFGQDANSGTRIHRESDHWGPEEQPVFKTDEEFARWLHMQDGTMPDDDMPGLIYDDQREREEQIKKDHAMALELSNPPVLDLSRTRSETAKAAEANQQHGEHREIADSEDGNAADHESLPPPAFSVRRMSSMSSVGHGGYGGYGGYGGCGHQDRRQVEENEDERYAMMQDSPPVSPSISPTARYGGHKRKDPGDSPWKS